jgi:hypothetical protein
MNANGTEQQKPEKPATGYCWNDRFEKEEFVWTDRLTVVLIELYNMLPQPIDPLANTQQLAALASRFTVRTGLAILQHSVHDRLIKVRKMTRKNKKR